MVAIKTWVPNELLKSADLNTAFLTAAQGYMPGVQTVPATVAVPIAAGGSAELPGLAPLAANDPAGYWNAANSRVKVPTGLGGLHLVYVVCSTTGGTKGDMGYMVVTGGNQGGAHYFTRQGGAGSYSFTLCYWATLAAGAELYVTGSLLTSAGDMTLARLSVLRLATFGLYQ